MRMVVELTKERNYYRNCYHTLVNSDQTSLDGELLKIPFQQRTKLATLPSRPSSSAPPDGHQSMAPSPSRSSLAEPQHQPSSSPSSIIPSPSSAHSPNHPLPNQIYANRAHGAMMRPPSAGDSSTSGFDPAYPLGSPSSSPYMRISGAAARGMPSPTTGRFVVRSVPDAAGFYPPSPSHRTREVNVSAPFAFSSSLHSHTPSSSSSSTTHATIPTQPALPLPFASPGSGGFEDLHVPSPYSHHQSQQHSHHHSHSHSHHYQQQQQQQPQQVQHPSTPVMSSPSLLGGSSPLSLKAVEDMLWDDFTATITN
jgi:hypothetical protein